MFSILRNNRFLLVLAILCLINIYVTPVLADVIVLRTGSELRGTIANKEQVASYPEDFSQISILIESEDQESSFQSIETADIHYIVLEDGTEKRVIEFKKSSPVPKAPKSTSTPSSSLYPTQRPPTKKYESSHVTDGILLSALGGGVALVGILVKFGEEKVTITESSIDYDEETYNGINYAMMIGGGVLFIGGIFLASSGGSPTNVSGVNLYMDYETRALGLSYAFNY